MHNQNNSQNTETPSDRDNPDKNDSTGFSSPERSLEQLIQAVTAAHEADIFLYSGPIDRAQAQHFFRASEQAHPRRDNVLLILTTNGGDADAAYKIARHLKRCYETFTLAVFGMCKSAGTILALGVNEIVISGHRGELGPLDVQILREDDLMQQSSGLDVFKAISSIRNQSFYIFEDILLDLQRKSGGFITTKTASDIATSMAIGLMSPINDHRA